jgi:hypothetical protein
MGKWTDAAMAQRKIYDTAAGYLTDDQALTVKGAYWEWEDLVKAGKTVKRGFRFRYGDSLWRTEQPTYTFVAHYVPGTQGTESLFSIIDETHAGTLEDPIPYEKNMRIYEGKYYTQYDVLYKCIKDSGIPLSHDLNQLIDHYVVEVVA